MLSSNYYFDTKSAENKLTNKALQKYATTKKVPTSYFNDIGTFKIVDLKNYFFLFAGAFLKLLTATTLCDWSMS